MTTQKGKPCGASYISAKDKCSKSTTRRAVQKAAVVGGGLLAAGAVGALAARRRPRLRPASSPPGGGGPGGGPGPLAPRPRGPSGLPLRNPSTVRPASAAVIPVRVREIPPPRPIAVLTPSRVRERTSKTARMRANTAAALASAQREIGRTAQLEVQRIGRLGNTAAAMGEAAGMASKTGFREVRLRVEKLRRRYEPGYRKPARTAPPAQRRLAPGSDRPLGEVNFTPLAQQPGGARLQAGQFQMNRPLQREGLQKRDAKDKKYVKVVKDPETGRKKKVRYGAKGYKIAPGTSKGDRYCARSFGDMKSHNKDCSGADRNTPLCLSRSKWKCSGKKSRRS